jgi:hypothetical protein
MVRGALGAFRVQSRFAVFKVQNSRFKVFLTPGPRNLSDSSSFSSCKKMMGDATFQVRNFRLAYRQIDNNRRFCQVSPKFSQ